MKIGIDISQIVYGTGVSVYTKQLVLGLLSSDNMNQYVLFGSSLRRREDIKAFTKSLMGKYSTIICPLPPTILDILWNRLHVLNIESIIGDIDVFHSSDWVQPPTKALKVTTVHDLVPILYPEWSHPRLVKVHKRRLQKVKNCVDRIIVPSDTTKKDLVKLGFDEGKMKVINEAPGNQYFRQENNKIDQFKIKYKIKGNYLMAVGTAPRKNIKRVIKAFINSDYKDKYQLVITGEHNNKPSIRDNVKFIGYINDLEMPSAYSGAGALIYPSLYEGFGLPILEAFACETPVITSNRGSMKEVAEGAAFLVNPRSTKKIKMGINEVLSQRESYIKKGKEKVKKYSWEKAVKETIKVYEQK